MPLGPNEFSLVIRYEKIVFVLIETIQILSHDNFDWIFPRVVVDNLVMKNDLSLGGVTI